jgi:selenocysteine lyase/cysteine desulfurase
VRVRDLGEMRCGIVTFDAEGARAGEIKAALAKQGFNVTVSTRTSTLLDMDARGVAEVVRASVHCYNTEDECDRLVKAVAAAARG